MSVLWPRLASSAATAVYTEMCDTGDTPAPSRRHPAQIFAATGGRRATDDDIDKVRELITTTAQSNGFGGDAGQTDLIRFDRQLAPLLVEQMGVVPAEASNKLVWSFLTLVVAPDVTAWRFGYANRERWVCTDLTRHMFSRLWWQAFLLTTKLGDARDTTLLDQLSESDLNQLLERTRLGGQRPLVQAIAKAVIAAPADIARRDLIREVSLRMLRRMAHTEHMSLTEAQLELAVGETAEAVINALRSRN